MLVSALLCSPACSGDSANTPPESRPSETVAAQATTTSTTARASVTSKPPKASTTVTRAPTTAAVEAATDLIKHVFQAPDTLWSLAERYLGSGSRWNELATLNEIPDHTNISNGTVLLIPMEGLGPAGPATTRPRATTTTRPRATTTTSNSAVNYRQPTIEILCQENVVGTYGWYQQSFGGSWNWDRLAGFGSITVDYGNGKSYTSWTNEDAQKNAFWHKYYSPGSYTVTATITDDAGQKDVASCTWTWQAPSVSTVIPATPTTIGSLSGSADTGCSSGFYLSASGLCTLSPTQVAYPGWTARCLDGWYSYSLSPSGTCSYHGGVALWASALQSSSDNGWLDCYFDGTPMWGSVFVAPYSWNADFVVHVSEYSWDSDLTVFIPDYSWSANSCGIWASAPYSWSADFSVYFTDYSWEADFTIDFTDYSWSAGR